MKLQKKEPLPTQGLLDRKSLAVMPLELFSSELSAVPHQHDAYQLMYVQETKGGENIVDFRKFAIEPGRLFLLAPGQAHQRLSVHEKGMLIFFSEEFLQSTGISAHDVMVLFGAVYQHPYLDLPEKLQQSFMQLVMLIQQELEETEPSNAILSRYLYILLTYLLRECHREISRLTPARHSERLFRLSNLIEHHYREHRSVTFYAEALGITPKHLNSICRQSLHTTVADMLHDRILLESKRLLYFSSLSVKEIAYDLGFEDVSYFIRFFKRITGITPMQLRSGGSESTILAGESAVT